jgi:hypothetical protein
VRVIYETSTEADATIVAHRLRAEGFHPDVLGGTLGMAAGELPVWFLYRVVVPTHEAEDAAIVLAKWEFEGQDDIDDADIEKTRIDDPDAEHHSDDGQLPTLVTIMNIVAVVITAIVLWLALTA